MQQGRHQKAIIFSHYPAMVAGLELCAHGLITDNLNENN